MMKKQILLLAIMLLPMVAGAETVEIDGIYYELVSKIKEATVISNPNNSGNVVIPASVTYGGVEYSVTSIGDKAFKDCSDLTSVTIGNSVTSIGKEAFAYCLSLTSVNIPNSVTSLGNSAFYNCSSLASVAIPNSVTSIGSSVFYGCSGLTTITIPNSVTSIGGSVFRACSGLTSVTIPNSVTSIGSYAFRDCSRLTSVTIPNSVTSIGISAFSGCSGLVSLIIGSGVKIISSQAFASCKDLTDVYCLAEEVPRTSSDAFEESYIEYATLHVPTVSIEAYEVVEPWENFKEIKLLTDEDIPVTPDPEKCATPTIAFVDGKLTFSCETEGVEYVSEITCSDAKKHYETEIPLACTYQVSVYAMKAGYLNSEVATMAIDLRAGGVKGDVNGDGVVNVTDVTNTINIILGKK